MVTVAHLLTTTKTTDRRDPERLLAHVLRKPREWILAHPEATVRTTMAARYRRLLRRLERGEPLPYLLGEHWFYGRPFTVNRSVLIPRPESELLVELALDRTQNAECRMQNSTIVDVGTGSGCIAVTLAALLSHMRVVATDTSTAALRASRANARRHGVSDCITFLKGDLLGPLEFILSGARAKRRISRAGRGDQRYGGTARMGEILRRAAPQDKLLILANLPYLTTAEWRSLPQPIRDYEPREALDGGPDGLKHFRKLFSQFRSLYTSTPLHLYTFLEIDPRRKRAITALVRKTLPKWRASWHRDLAGRWRILDLCSSMREMGCGENRKW